MSGLTADTSPTSAPTSTGEVPLAEERSVPSTGKGGPHLRAATLGNFMEVARRSKAKLARLLHLKRSRPSSDVESVHRGAPPRPGTSAHSSSRVA